MARRFARLSKPMRRAEAGRAAAFAVMLAAALALGGVRGGCQAVTATDVDGHRLNLPGQDTKAAVLFFVTNDCPITNSSMPEINRLVAAYATRGLGSTRCTPIRRFRWRRSGSMRGSMGCICR